MSKAEHLHADLDWSTAAVADGSLTVGFTARPSPEWVERLREIVDRLQRAGSPWDAVSVKPKRLKVACVRPGAEDDLRHFLEGAVLQTNADLVPEESGGADRRSAADETMTARFQGFTPAS